MLSSQLAFIVILFFQQFCSKKAWKDLTVLGASPYKRNEKESCFFPNSGGTNFAHVNVVKTIAYLIAKINEFQNTCDSFLRLSACCWN